MFLAESGERCQGREIDRRRGVSTESCQLCYLYRRFQKVSFGRSVVTGSYSNKIPG